MKNLKKFETISQYEGYISGSGVAYPNVSYCKQENEVFMRAHEMIQLTCEDIHVVDQGNGTVYFVLGLEGTDGGTINILADGNEYQTTVSSEQIAVIDFGYDLTPGTTEIEYSYSGNRLYLPSPTCYATISAPKYDTGEIPMSTEDIVIGVNDLYVVADIPENATGTITFTLEDGSSDTATVTGGRASISMDTSGLSAGTNTVTASYSGDENWTSASGTAEFHAKYQTIMDVTIGGVAVGESFVITVSVPENATGTITLTIPNYYSGSAQLLNGMAKFIVEPNPLPAGTYTATVTYSGDDYYAPSTSTVIVDVE